jgi:hypothetical protein
MLASDWSKGGVFHPTVDRPHPLSPPLPILGEGEDGQGFEASLLPTRTDLISCTPKIPWVDHSDR